MHIRLLVCLMNSNFDRFAKESISFEINAIILQETVLKGLKTANINLYNFLSKASVLKKMMLQNIKFTITSLFKGCLFYNTSIFARHFLHM